MLVRAKARPYRMSDEGLKVRKTWLIWSTIVMLCALSLWSSHLMGQTRSALQQEYLQLLQDNPSPFGSAPITHITLQRGAFTGGVTSDIYNATIVPEGSDISESRSGQKVRMDVGGWDTSVLFAYTTANLGLGILGRGGERQVIFLDQSSLVSNGGVNYFGAASFAGGGALGYYLLPAYLLPTNVTLTFMAGASQLAVTHKTNNAMDGGHLATYTYPVNFTHGGIDIKLELNRFFSVFFWYNYITAKVGTTKLKKSSDWRTILSYAAADNGIGADQELFWQSAPRQRLGIDMIAAISRLQIHLGGIFGLIGTLGTQPKYIYDKSVSLAVSYTFGG